MNLLVLAAILFFFVIFTVIIIFKISEGMKSRINALENMNSDVKIENEELRKKVKARDDTIRLQARRIASLEEEIVTLNRNSEEMRMAADKAKYNL